MSFYRAQVVLSNDSGQVEDQAVNTFHFITDEVDTPTTERATIDNALRALYQAMDAVVLSVHTGTSLRILQYDMEDATPRIPLADNTHTLAGAADALPNEVAMCVSYRGAITSGINRRRNRGRIYLGPLNQVAVAGTGDRVINATTITSVLGFFDTFADIDLQLGASSIRWCVFSRADALGLPIGVPVPPEGEGFAYTNVQLVAGFKPIKQVWIDNAFDTQRRRGRVATSRTTVAID